MMQVTAFRPSVHGFAFANTWRDTVFGVVASRGRCGGMVFSALDHYVAGTPPPSGSSSAEPPAHASGLARLIWRRQLESLLGGFGHNLRRFVWLTYRPAGGPNGVEARTLVEARLLMESLDSGRPVPLGLLSALSLRHIARNHQVLAYGAGVVEGRLSVRVYDPNFPGRDDVVLEVPADGRGPVVERVGRRLIPWRGFFLERYEPLRVLPGADSAESRAPDSRFMLGAVALGVLFGLLGWCLFARGRRRTGLPGRR